MRRGRRVLQRLATLAIAVLVPWTLAPLALAQEELKPFAAAYDVVYRGMNAGTTSLALSSEGGDRWRYDSKANARGIFRLVLSGEIRQTSQFTLGDGDPRPLRYIADDGTEDIKRDIRLEFDWKAGRARGTAETRAVDLPLREGLQDGMSVQIALIHALLRGERPTRYSLIDKDEVKEFLYQTEGTARVRTVLGELDTLVYSSRRPTSDRVTRVWYAPSLGYTPVQAERRRGDAVEWTMRLRSLQR